MHFFAKTGGNTNPKALLMFNMGLLCNCCGACVCEGRGLWHFVSHLTGEGKWFGIRVSSDCCCVVPTNLSRNVVLLSFRQRCQDEKVYVQADGFGNVISDQELCRHEM